jgi:hypothetical protein
MGNHSHPVTVTIKILLQQLKQNNSYHTRGYKILQRSQSWLVFRRVRKTAQKRLLSFVTSVCLPFRQSVNMELGSHWSDFHEMLYFSGARVCRGVQCTFCCSSTFVWRVRSCEKPPLAPSNLSFAWGNSASTGRSFLKFDIWVFFENLSRKFKFH